MPYTVLNPERISSSGLASFAFARHYSQNLVWFLFLALLRCFSSGGSPHIPIWFSIWCMDFTPCGLLHSDICASMLAYSSTQLFAVNHVLRRLPMPRHSPCALISFTICFLQVMSFLLCLFACDFWNLNFSSFRISALLFIQFSSCLLVFFEEYISINVISTFIQIYPS